MHRPNKPPMAISLFYEDKDLSGLPSDIIHDKSSSNLNYLTWHSLLTNISLDTYQYLIQEAQEEWLNTLKNVGTRRKYTRMLRYLNEQFNVNSKDHITKLSTLRGVLAAIQNSPEHTESIRLSLEAAYTRFCDFVRKESVGYIIPERGAKEQKQLEEANALLVHIGGLDSWNALYNKVIDLLDDPFKTLANILYTNAKESLSSLRIDHPYKNILSLTWSQFEWHKGVIHFTADQVYDFWGYGTQFPSELVERLRILMEERRANPGEYVFLKNGKSIGPKQVQRAFLVVSNHVGLEITSSMLQAIAISVGLQRRQQKQNTH